MKSPFDSTASKTFGLKVKDPLCLYLILNEMLDQLCWPKINGNATYVVTFIPKH